MLRLASTFVVSVILLPVAVAQAPAGTVTGRLTFAETQLPARFAEVVLVRVPEPGDLTPDEDHPPLTPARGARRAPEKLASISGLSGIDGSYSIAEVPPGDYFAIPRLPGYLVPIRTPANEKEARDIAALTAHVARVHVEANQLVTVNLMLKRGAVIAGTVRFADGSPVVGIAVHAEPADVQDFVRPVAYMPLQQLLNDRLNGIDLGHGSVSALTDDDGSYRIAGLPPGRYRVSTLLHTAGGTRYLLQGNGGGISGSPTNGHGDTTLRVYEPGVLRRTQAKVFEIRGEERVSDADFSVDLNGLYTLRGKVLAKEDRKPLKQAFVSVVEEGSGDPFDRMANAASDGTFEVKFLPPGTYTLTVEAIDFDNLPPPPLEAQETNGFEASSMSVGSTYEPVKQTVVVGEHDVVLDDMLLTRFKPEKKPDE